MKTQNGKWCLCNGFRANGTCVVCNKKRVGGYKKPHHKTMTRKMKNGEHCQVTACWAHKTEPDLSVHPPPVLNPSWCQVCGCSRHVDEFGDRVCWCDACHDIDWSAEREREGRWYSYEQEQEDLRYEQQKLWSSLEYPSSTCPCPVCGFSRHVDIHGDRVCWCDSCRTMDWKANGAAAAIWRGRVESRLIRYHFLDSTTKK